MTRRRPNTISRAARRCIWFWRSEEGSEDGEEGVETNDMDFGADTICEWGGVWTALGGICDEIRLGDALRESFVRHGHLRDPTWSGRGRNEEMSDC